ncbi:unnamed protein product [Heterobilharzia americana]|nr:unnamed protein product [Heterobilharzia americana]
MQPRRLNLGLGTGKCTSKTCSFSHNKNYLRICPRFLQQNCPLGSDACPLAHVLDPCRIPQCSFYEAGNCGRPHCPYLHVRHPAKSVVCSDFAYGRCPRGRLCNKRHVWVQKSLSNKFGHQKLSRLTIAIGNTASNKTLIATELEDNTDDHHSNPIAAPAGSLRNVYPAPEFIPLMSESDDFMVNTDASCL